MGWAFLSGVVCGIVGYIIHILTSADVDDLEEYITSLEEENSKLHAIVQEQEGIIEEYKRKLEDR